MQWKDTKNSDCTRTLSLEKGWVAEIVAGHKHLRWHELATALLDVLNFKRLYKVFFISANLNMVCLMPIRHNSFYSCNILATHSDVEPWCLIFNPYLNPSLTVLAVKCEFHIIYFNIIGWVFVSDIKIIFELPFHILLVY